MTPITPAKLVFLGIIVAGIGTFVLALWAWRRSTQPSGLSTLRRVLFSLGFVAVAAQLVLFALSWTHIGADYAMFATWARFVYPSFLLAVSFIAAGRGAARWWLLLSSFLLFVLCFFTMLSP